MKILISSYCFPPSIGGLEAFGEMLADELAESGNEVTVLTETPSDSRAQPPWRAIRRPASFDVLREMKRANLFIQNQISLGYLWAALLCRCPTVFIHQTWLRDSHGQIDWVNRFKRRFLRFGKNVAVSKALADDLPVPCRVIYNSVDNRYFFQENFGHRNLDVAFVGRLVTFKGVTFLLHALRILAEKGRRLRAVILGDGPERLSLERFSSDFGLTQIVEFKGACSKREIAKILNSTKIQVVPSIGGEGLPLAAVEGLACGCLLVASDQGGLPEAVGPCGIIVRQGSSEDIAVAIEEILDNDQMRRKMEVVRADHLQKFSRKEVFGAYQHLVKER